MNLTEFELDALLRKGHVRVATEHHSTPEPRLPRPVLLAEEMAPESRFQAVVVRAAEAQGYKAYHTYRSTRSPKGWPDLALAKPGHLLLIECKTNAGKVTAEQEEWLAVLHHPPWVIAEVWRPADWQHVLERLGY